MDVAAHHAREVARNLQAQAGAAGAAQARIVGLKEAGEELAHGGLVHARAGVLHRQHNAVFTRLGAPHANGDAPFAGEFERVAQQVEQNLAHPGFVTLDPGGHVGVALHAEPQAFVLRFAAHQRFHIVQHLAQRHG